MLKKIFLLCSLVSSVAQADNISAGFFCEAQGQGIWANQSSTFRWQTSLIPANTAEAPAEAILYVNEVPAAAFPLAYMGNGVWTGVSNTNANVAVRVEAVAGGTAHIILKDWRNPGALAEGPCGSVASHGF